MMKLGSHLIILVLLLGSHVPLNQQLLQLTDELKSSANKISNDDYLFPTQDNSKSDFSNENVDCPTQSKEYLNHHLATEVCKLDRGAPRLDRLLNNTYLKHCSRYKLGILLSNEALMSFMHDSTEKCQMILYEFDQLDEKIDKYRTSFENILSRYNCHNGYSVKWDCEDCKKAYKDWLCATSLPYFTRAERVKPCLSFCERVEQRCPYLNPVSKEQYGGQPVFICRDLNIPFVPEITPDIPYGESTNCYDLFHLSDNVAELENDGLSRYRYDHCLKKGFIVE